MSYYYLENLTSQAAKEGNPWDFKITEQISEDIRTNKTLRQAFYQNPGTRHSFYSMIEPLNPNARISKNENPPHVLHGFAVEYDTLHLSPERILEGVKQMPLKPRWIEQSLGRNWRLVFTLPRGIFVGGYDFCQHILKSAEKWLNVHVLPCCDVASLTTPTRYLCNGGAWLETGHGDLPQDSVQAFLVACSKEFNFKPCKTDVDVPLDVVEKAIRVKFPDFTWPTAFELDSQGPSWWVEGSTSPSSAIVKKGGMISFAAHATKPFTPWSEILGEAFSKQWSEGAIAKATEDIYFDDHDYYMKGPEGIYRRTNKDVLVTYFKVRCRMTTKGDKQTGVSQIDEALQFIHDNNWVSSAGSFAFQRPGPLHRNGHRILNTYFRKPMTPAAGSHSFGPTGNFPFMSALASHMFGSETKQFWSFIAWYQYFYKGAANWDPKPGQNIFIGGVHNSGKTLMNRYIIGASVGGYMDAGEYVMGHSVFNAYLFEVGYWGLDDDTTSGSPANVQRTSNIFKKIAANQTILSHAKFQKQSMVDFGGRIGATLNLDTNSMRLIGPQDAATLEKTSIFRCNEIPFSFPGRDRVTEALRTEMPYFLAWLLEVKIPDCVIPYNRYGWEPYHDDLLLDRTNQSQSIAPFKELLIECLCQYFRNNPQAQQWRGTVTQLMRMLAENPLNDHVMRSLKMDQVNRYLEQIQKEGLLQCEADSGHMKTRLWIFLRAAFEAALREAAPSAMPVIETTNTKNPFEK